MLGLSDLINDSDSDSDSCTKLHQIKTLFTYHFPKTCPYSLPKINWTVALSKLKFTSCGHQITFLVNSTFSKILHIIPPSSPTIFASHLGHQKCIPLLSQNSMNSYPNHDSEQVSAWCWKTRPFPHFLCIVIFRWWPSDLMWFGTPKQGPFRSLLYLWAYHISPTLGTQKLVIIGPHISLHILLWHLENMP